VLFTLVYAGKYGTIQKLNTTQKKANNTKHSKKSYPGSVATYDTQPGNEVGLLYNVHSNFCQIFTSGENVGLWANLHENVIILFWHSISMWHTDRQTPHDTICKTLQIDWLIEHGFTSAPTQYRLYVAEIKLNELYFAFKETLLPTNSSPIQSHHILWNLNH